METETKASLYNRHNFTIAKIASKEESRYTLRAILVDKNRTVCTDGHRLLEVTTPGFDRANFPQVPGVNIAANGERFLFPADAALEVAKAIPRKASIPVLCNAAPLEPVKNDEGILKQVGFVATDLEVAKPVITNAVTGTFPNTDAVYPKDEPILKVGFNARYLKELAAWFESFAQGEPTVKMTFYGADKAVLFEAEAAEYTGQQAKALLMPVRV